MNANEAQELLTRVRAVEHTRAFDAADFTAWSQILDDVSLADAVAVCRDYYRESRYPIMPADIIDRVRRLRAGRRKDWETAGGTVPTPPVDGDHVALEQQWTRAFNYAIGSGATTEQADAYACRAIGVERVREQLTTHPVGTITQQVEQSIPRGAKRE